MENKEKNFISFDIFLDESIKQEKANVLLHEMFATVDNPTKNINTIEHTIVYSRLKQILHFDINRFCREFTDLKMDLEVLRLNVGEYLDEEKILQYANNLKEKYNDKPNNIGIETHLEATLFDYSLIVFVLLKRDRLFMHKFVFRFRKPNIKDGVYGLNVANM